MVIKDWWNPVLNTQMNQEPFEFGLEWKITFDLKLDGHTAPGWENIFRVSASDNDVGTCGDRYPAICLRSGTSNVLTITTCRDGIANYIYDHTVAAINLWIHYELGQEDRNGTIWYYVKENGNIVHEIINHAAQTFSGLNLWSGGKHYQACEACAIKNWAYSTTGNARMVVPKFLYFNGSELMLQTNFLNYVRAPLQKLVI